MPDLAALRFRGGIALALLTAAVPAVTTQAAMPFLAEFLNRIGEIGVAAVTLGMLVARQTSRQSCNDAGKTRRSKVMLLGPDVPS
ncbi:MAG: hypothetical protein ABJF01_20105 [bacterium]